jgi:hypothetical protein
VTKMKPQEELNLRTSTAGEEHEPLTVLGPEAIAFILDLEICPGGSCPKAMSVCDPRCPALRAWVEEISGG